MRWLIGVLGWVAVVCTVQAQDGAQTLFETMEKKLASAKGYQVDFETDSETTLAQGKAKGTLLLVPGNRMKFTVGYPGIDASLITFVSDGKSLAILKGLGAKPERTIEPVNDKYQDTLSGWGFRIGLFMSMSHVNRGDDDDYRKLKLSNFQTAGKEKVEGRQANVIEFTLTKGTVGTKHKLWLDTQTGLPLQLVAENGGVFRVVEIYRNWQLNPQLPDETFDLPK